MITVHDPLFSIPSRRSDDELQDKEHDFLYRRGPDHQGEASFKDVRLRASVLQMRTHLIQQPVVKESDDDSCSVFVLAWNGEIYQYFGEAQQKDQKATITDSYSQDTSDTEVVVANLSSISGLNLRSIANCLSRFFNAEYAFVITTAEAIYFGRDPFGRRSLMRKLDECDRLCQIASVSDMHGNWQEIEPGIVYSYDTRTNQILAEPIPVLPLDLRCAISQDASDTLCSYLREAVSRRVQQDHQNSVLFSGGIDSVVIARIALEFVDSLSLVNVSFHDDMVGEKDSDAPSAADTVAALESYGELCQLFPEKDIQFVQKQVPWTELMLHEEHIRHLLHPKESLMDLNIASALWFAARECPGRVILTGLGADEQMGGYGRHRNAKDLRSELDKDIHRLWDRNLGRDCRVLSDHSKEARFPFLDPWVVQYLASLPLSEICDFSLPVGEGDKRILRLLAQKLGLSIASRKVKRAIQFGSRISHVSDSKRFGSRRKAKGEKSV